MGGGGGGGGEHMELLGHKIRKGVDSVRESRAKAIASYTRPRTKQGLRTFLGMISYYRQFVKNLAHHTAVLSPSTSRTAPNRVIWTSDMDNAFGEIWHCISVSWKLTILLPEDTLSLVTNALVRGIGGVLQVQQDGEWRAEAYFSRQTRGAEQRYSATALEALAVVESIFYFSYYLYGKEFVVMTDHRPLCSMLYSDKLNGSLRQMAMKMQPWLVTITYLPGRENLMLSRQEWTQTDELETASPFPSVSQSGGGGCE